MGEVGVAQHGDRVIVVRSADGPVPATADLLGAAGPVPLPADPPSGPDRLVLPPGSPAARWWSLVRAALRACGPPLVVLTVAGAALPGLLTLRINDAVVFAALLPDLATGGGLLLLPLVALIVIGLDSLLSALCLAGTVALVTGWAATGRPPGIRGMLTLVGHRIWVVWISLAVVHGLQTTTAYGIPWLAAAGLLDPWAALRTATFVGWVTTAGFTAATVLVGVLGPVLLFERGRGLRRALHLLWHGSRVPATGLVLASAASSLLPSWAGDLVEYAAGEVPAVITGLVLAAVGSAVWAVCATVTYAALVATESADRGDLGPVTAGFLRDSLAAGQA
jgi:hypothetical protein